MTDKLEYDGFDVETADEFDPLAPIEFDPDELDGATEEEKSYYTDPVPPIAQSIEEAAAARRAKYPVPELTRAEKIAKAIKGMPGQKKLLLHIIDWCREERVDSDIVDEIVAFERGGVYTYSPESIIATLVRYEALEQTNAPTQADGSAQAPTDGVDGQRGALPDDGAATAEPVDADALEGAPAGACEPAGAPDFSAAGPQDGAPMDEPEYLEVSRPEPARYRATDEGLDAVAAEDPAARFAAFMDANAVYAPIFRIVLENCDCEQGCTKKQIDALVDHDPICRSPRRFSGYFIDKLEDADAIIFEGAWRTTDVGRAMLAPDGLIGSL